MSKDQLGLFDEQVDIQSNVRNVTDWPDPERFPHNFKQEKVENIVLTDLANSHSPLVVTGFTSLDYIIDFLADLPACHPQTIRLLIGSEPAAARRNQYGIGKKTLPQEVLDYWLNAGISLRLCFKIVMVMDMLKEKRLQSRYVADEQRKLHSKIYVGDEAITLGSSNFSFTGMRKQLEANARFQKLKEPKRFREAQQLAENYWALGDDYNDYLLELLQKLLKVVSWQEALGRACGELLEGDWAQKYIKSHLASGGVELWPSQKVGIAQALWMVENVGSVLVADATGSGKTRMGAHLLRAVMDRIWSTGRTRKDITALVCPPGPVEASWKEEATSCGLPLISLSHGILSHKRSDQHGNVVQTIRRAQSLAIDEAHNFLNAKSARTRGLHSNMADVVVMFTATPINRGLSDLLMIVDLLGADNLDDSALSLFDRLAKQLGSSRKGLQTTFEERLEMQKEVQRFTLRRTKSMLNAMVDQQPDAYKDNLGKKCRYPEHSSKTYATEETQNDLQLAKKIRELAVKIRGLSNLRSGIELPDSLRGQVDEEVYIRGRLQGAKGLAFYNLMSRLRSSRAAMIEHLLGTEVAARQFGIRDFIKNEDTGNVLDTLKKSAGKIQKSSLANKLPSWLTNEAEHRQAVDEEIKIYSNILCLVEQMSDSRERSKAKQLKKLLGRHPLIIAFDSCLITLEIIKQLLDAEKTGCEVIVATGSKDQSKKKVNKLFSLGSEARDVVALCSDAMSEGLNLQQASAVMLLDMPSVIRIAEQRVGRVDRMNSPHRQIEVWWPLDSDSFSLKTDRKFFQRHAEVRDILGSNLPLPDDLLKGREALLEKAPSTAYEMIRSLNDMEKKGQTWDGLRDAFQPVRDLVDPDDALVPKEVYKDVRQSKARVISTVSLVRSKRPWAFMAIAGAEHGAPKWLLMEQLSGRPMTHLEDVSEKLRELLAECHEAHPMDKVASELIEKFLNQVLKAEGSLLPRKKQRALDEMKIVLGHYLNQAKQAGDRERAEKIAAVLRLQDVPPHDEERPDLDAVAEAWLDLIRDTWYVKLTQRRRFKPLRLSDIRKDLKNNPISTERILEAFSGIPSSLPIHTRVVSAIIGVPGSHG